ncbi:MAG: retroviral-like aspartic protease family protein [Treponema sp.]|nr:retroviral-like aspartic protease family protein [Treponema sp.]
MGTVYADIILKNSVDISSVKRGYMTEKEIRTVSVTALVDTGAGTLIINESIREKLGLEIIGLRGVTVAGGTRKTCQVTEPVHIQWKNRDTACRAIVLPGEGEVLLGAIPLEDMDLIVNPVKQELAGAHGDEIVCYVK